MPTRREVLGAATGFAALAAEPAWLRAVIRSTVDLESRRPLLSERKFTSRRVEEAITRIKPLIGDPELAWMFENCLPNTLDTTVFFSQQEGRPDTYVTTGDIDAMWLRDSSAQVWPYLWLARDDEPLRTMIAGLICRQAQCIQLDPYANAYWRDLASTARLKWSANDSTEMKPGVAERKWEIDSLCHPVRLAHGFWRNTGDTTPFREEFWKAMRTVVETFRVQQRKDEPGPYRFQRSSDIATETQFLGGYGNPTRKVGLIHSMFRPSDDACLFPFFIPGNLLAVVTLRKIATMANTIAHDSTLANDADGLAREVETAAHLFGVIRTRGSNVWAYEADGYGTQLFMDDANAPNLMSLPYLGVCDYDNPLYRSTRAAVWSARNPYFFHGAAGEGIGSPHSGLHMIWPMSQILRALTSRDDAEIVGCLRAVKTTHGGTGFIHESFDQGDPARYTRSWFAWANSLFGELIVWLAQCRPALLRNI
jgi:meiotically up-regulated gene 157 (Mug157) protein